MRETVGRPVGEDARHDVGGQPSASRRSALGSGQHDEHLGVDVGAEVLLPREQPLVAVLHGAGRVGPDVASALALGQEHPTFPCFVGVEAAQPPEQVVTGGGGGVALHDVGGTRGHAETAVDGRLGLRHEVRHRSGHDAGDGAPGQCLQADEPVAHQVRLVLRPARMVDDLVHLLPPPVVAAQDRPVLVGLLGAWGDDLAHQGTESAHVLLGQGAVAGVGEVPVQEGPEVGVERVPVQSGSLVEFGVVGKHPPMLRRRGGPAAGPGRAFT